MKYIIIFFTLALLISCKETTEPIVNKKTTQEKPETLERRIVRTIEAGLDIPATEKYSYKIYKEHLDNDDSLDYIITINRLEFAKQKAINGEKLAKRAEVGF